MKNKWTFKFFHVYNNYNSLVKSQARKTSEATGFIVKRKLIDLNQTLVFFSDAYAIIAHIRVRRKLIVSRVKSTKKLLFF